MNEESNFLPWLIGAVVAGATVLMFTHANAGVAIADNGRERYEICDTTGLWYDLNSNLLVVGRDLDGDGETDNRVRFTTNYHIFDDQGATCDDLSAAFAD